MYRSTRIVILSGLFAGVVFSGCNRSSYLDRGQLDMPVIDQLVVNHTLLDSLLEQYVSEEGLVQYASIKNDQLLEAYLEELASVNPDALPEKEAIAYWINAYNAYTIKLIVENYPVGSIREISPFRIKGVRLAIPKINSPFEYKIAVLGGETYSLDDIEHGILRRRYNEPRIHFALVCAAISCPPLRREAYTGAELDSQLDDQGRVFLHDTSKNQVDLQGNTVRLSKIFSWFRKDFGSSDEDLQVYLSPFFEGETAERLKNGSFKVKHLGYDWTLNDYQREDL